jgi:hypothetical protein
MGWEYGIGRKGKGEGKEQEKGSCSSVFSVGKFSVQFNCVAAALGKVTQI